jgi:hypothetical protein
MPAECHVNAHTSSQRLRDVNESGNLTAPPSANRRDAIRLLARRRDLRDFVPSVRDTTWAHAQETDHHTTATRANGRSWDGHALNISAVVKGAGRNRSDPPVAQIKDVVLCVRTGASAIEGRSCSLSSVAQLSSGRATQRVSATQASDLKIEACPHRFTLSRGPVGSATQAAMQRLRTEVGTIPDAALVRVVGHDCGVALGI